MLLGTGIREERTDSKVSADAFQVQHHRLHELLIYVFAVLVLWNITFRSSKALDKFGFQIGVARELRSKLNSACRILDCLHGFQAGKFVEKPAAACVHQHSVTLEFEQLEGTQLFVGRERASRNLVQEI